MLDLEYLNPYNILVSVLRTTPGNYDWKNGRAHDEARAKVVLYYMHPNIHKCSESSENDELIFTCWRDASEGMFPQDDSTLSAVTLGVVCPEARRFPSFGKMWFSNEFHMSLAV